MKTISRLMMLSILLAGCFSLARHVHAGIDNDDRGKETVERRQKIEIERFYAGKGGNAPMTPMAIELYNDAVKFFEKNEFELAREALKESLSLEPRNALALELLGEIENLQQNFKMAENYYKQSYLVSPSTRLRQKIEKIQKENLVEKDLDTYDEEHFIIKYRKGEQGYEGYWLKNLLRDAYRQISQDFGAYFNHKTTVLFYSGNEFHDVTGQSLWVGGLYDGKIRLPAYRQGFRELDLRAAAVHEMTHAFVASLSGMRAPPWIHEGLAEYEQNKIQPVNTTVFNAAIRTKTLMPMSRLLSETLRIEKMDPLEVALFYQEVFELVRYMVERFQMYRMKEILLKFKEGKPAEQAIEEVLGMSTSQLEYEWLSAIPKS
ncbi:MAG: peptidase MA family metallohydrolase [Candidatus Omnitrophica bacterium]|nr:peptidase MA family metallohydrolase [Candidatus Omnitrophota bacterium]